MNNNKKLKEVRTIAYTRFKQDPRSVYTLSQIRNLMADIKKDMGLPKSITSARIMEIIKSSNKFKDIVISFPSKKYTRYAWGKESLYEVLLSLDNNAYFCHLSALYFHKLLDVDISDIYLNIEQSPKPESMATMLQENINKAFSRPPRITTNITDYQERRIYLLNGMHTAKMGVIKISGPKKENIFVTDIERTLIDIAVRPHYSGGVHNVLNVYKKVIKTVPAEKIFKMLKKLNYSYPYHQAIGFYLDNAGLGLGKALDIKKEFPMKYDFYLTYQMDKPEYCAKWRLFYPNTVNLFSVQVPDITCVTKIGNPLFSLYFGQNKFTVFTRKICYLNSLFLSITVNQNCPSKARIFDKIARRFAIRKR